MYEYYRKEDGQEFYDEYPCLIYALEAAYMDSIDPAIKPLRIVSDGKILLLGSELEELWERIR